MRVIKISKAIRKASERIRYWKEMEKKSKAYFMYWPHEMARDKLKEIRNGLKKLETKKEDKYHYAMNLETYTDHLQMRLATASRHVEIILRTESDDDIQMKKILEESKINKKELLEKIHASLEEARKEVLALLYLVKLLKNPRVLSG